ncbi:MAG: hypothetical protein EOO31_08455 [Comamonadaceae bacterium]|nr:MAG: hypothetical protein EOO31_08455 [Comamonadaceae bacterium]
MSFLAITSRIASASALSLAAQALFGVLMLRLFSPSDVGTFTVVAQVSFFWMTLALAQSPLRFLANIHLSPVAALKQAMRSSGARWLLLAPTAAMALWFAKLPSFWPFLAWASSIALLQMAWYVAQAWVLRTGTARSAALARALPPTLAVVIAGSTGVLWPGSGPLGLLLAATISYGFGALWLINPVNKIAAPQVTDGHADPQAFSQRDDRSAGLRFAHTAADAIAGTAILLVWQRAYGLAEASYLAVLLRLLGLFPAVVYAAWPQVLLSRGQQQRKLSVWVGIGGACGTALAGLVATFALQTAWFAPSWQGMSDYIAPLVLWQCSACLFAAHGHMPFQRGIARQFSWATIGFNTLQLGVLMFPLILHSPGSLAHLWLLAGTSAFGLMVLMAWISGRNLK